MLSDSEANPPTVSTYNPLSNTATLAGTTRSSSCSNDSLRPVERLRTGCCRGRSARPKRTIRERSQDFEERDMGLPLLGVQFVYPEYTSQCAVQVRAWITTDDQPLRRSLRKVGRVG